MRLAQYIRPSVVTVTVIAWTLLLGSSARAQDSVADSFCALFSPVEVNEALATEVEAIPVMGSCGWRATDEDVFTSLLASWNLATFEQAKDTLEGGEDRTIGGRPAYYAPAYNMLLIQLDAGTLTLQFTTSLDVDVEAALTKLGELAVSRSGSLIAPSAPVPASLPPESHADPGLEALFPATIGGQPLTIQSMAGATLEQGTEGSQQVEDALAAQGKTLADVTFAFGFTEDFSSSVSAIRVAGADASALIPTVVSMQSGGEGATPTPGEVAGKSVLTVEGALGTQYYYAKDDVIWVVQAQEPMLTEIFAALP
jgi:hypothetical protein